MRRNYKSGFRTNNAITYNVIANKIIKEHTIIDDTIYSKKVNNTNLHYKRIEKKYKCDYDDYEDDNYDSDIDSDY